MMKLNPGQPLAKVIDSEVDQFMDCVRASEAQHALRTLMGGD